jgi:CshA-type fibril repeat protein
MLKGALASVAALALAFAGLAISPEAPPAAANPAAAAGTTTITAVGAYSGTVPAGVCSVTATVLGAAGGSSGVAATVNGNGGGARITTTFPVVPGLAYSGSVGGGGQAPNGSSSSSLPGAGGANGGGTGGFSQTFSGIRHHGAGGGGWTEFQLGGTTAILAGGGGGGGGGHSSTSDGNGGNAGLPTGTGVTVGSSGNAGKDSRASNPQPTATGGQGGQAAAGGAGGTNSLSSAVNGVAGSGRNGGIGGPDPNPDAGGGGGGGYTGGGGGASTTSYNGQYSADDVSGAGGGGGSSYIAASVPLGSGTSTPSSISSTLGARIASGAGPGANGSVSLVWNSCVYDLVVDKSVTPTSTPTNSTVTWTVAVTNNGPSAMTQGDTVTITDTLPGAGAKTITAISVSGGSNAILGRGAVTCTAAVGAAMPASLDCSRPYQIGSGAASGVRGLDVGETLTVTYTQLVTEAAGTTLTNTATVTDRATPTTNNTDSAATTVLTPPVAVDDVRTGNAVGTVVNVPVTTNDTGTLQAGSVVLWNPAGAGSVIASPYVVAGEGTWTVASDVVTFTPEPGFKGDPTPVTYRVTATNGLSATATVTITYLPTATDDSRSNLVIGSATSVPVLTNDDGTWDTPTLRLVDPGSGSPSAGPVVVAGEGTWTISGADVVFTPAPGFLTDPSPISYRITDTTGDTVSATVTLTYVPAAADDSSLGNTLDAPVDVSVLTNDTGSFTVGSLVFVSGLGTTLNVPGEGTWTVQPGGVIRFTPAPGFKGDPTPVSYRITDTTGDSVTATVTITYVPAAADDSSLGNTMGATVSLDVLDNDNGTWTAGSVRIMDGLSAVSTLPVAGQGTWSVVGDAIQFVPEPGFLTDPTPVHYRVQDTTLDFATATVTVTYLPQATDDTLGGLVIGSPATVNPLTNDTGDFTVSTLVFVSGLGTTLAVPGEGTWTISGADVTFTPEPGFLLDPTPVGYRVTDSTGDSVQATISLDYGPGAVDDSSLGNALGAVVNLNVLSNDTGDFDTSTLGFGPGNVGVGATLTVPGEGAWTVSAPGVITFTPEPGFLTDPAPVAYVVQDTLGDSTGAVMTITYLPAAADDSDLDNAFGTTVDVDVLGNDTGVFVAGTVAIMDGLSPVPSLYVAGEGTWIVQPDDTISFVPDPGFLTDPAPVHYRVRDTSGDYASAVVTVTYLPLAVDDNQGGLSIGSIATVSVLTNDSGDFVVSSLRLVDPSTGTPTVGPVTVAGQGVWTISGADVVFTPAPGFLVDPDPITYRITDSTGDTASADVELDYGPGAADDSDLGNALGTAVDVSVFDNDSGVFDPATLGFGGATGPGATQVVAGEGTWEVLAGGVIRFTPEPGFLVDPTPVRYYADDVTGDPADALITITYLPAAANDSDLGNAFGSSVNVDVLGNDTGSWAAGSVLLLDGVTPTASLNVLGEGTWTVQLDDTITFVPEPGFLTDPGVVSYQVTDVTGDTVDANITVTYLPLAVDDAQGGLAIGSVATVSVLSNDDGDFDIPSLRLVDPGTGSSTAGPVTVAGQGVWSISGADIVFTPAPGFLADPDPISYRITDTTGDTTSAQITLDYSPAAADDTDLGNTIGDSVDLDVWANDTGSFDITTLGFGGGTGIGTTLVVAGQGTWSVLAGGMVRFVPEPGFEGDPTPVRYYVSDVTGDPVDALMTITYVPAADDDSDLGNAFGTDVNVDVLANDTGDFVAGTVMIMDGLLPVTSLVVPGEGTWTVEPDDTITFDPDAGFLTDPSPIHYRVQDSTLDFATAVVTVTYLPQAVDDSRDNLVIGTVTTVPVLANDHGDFSIPSLRIVDPSTGTPTASPVTVAGQGVWSISGADVVFTPAPGFLTDPDPIDYRITDTTGDVTSAQLTLDYVPAAVDDDDLGNTIGDTVDVSVLSNDTGSFDTSTLGFGGATGPGTTLVVAGEGTWTVLGSGAVRFVPEPGFEGDPTPVRYYLDDVTGDSVDALITVTYVPAAADDSDLGNAFGTDVNVDVLANDTGDFVAGTVRLLDGGTPVTTLTVAGEGVWTVQPDDSITFDPDPTFLTDPTDVTYQVTDSTGDTVSAQVTITYLPLAADDADLGNTLGSTVNVAVLGNDSGDFVLTSVRIVAPGGSVLQLVVAGEGTWRANSDGTVTFIPESGFLLDPAPVDYEVTDVTGDLTGAQLTITYVPTVAPDVQAGFSFGAPATLNVLSNDTGDFDLSTLRVIDPGTNLGVMSLNVPGEGDWAVDTALGRLTFTPEPGFLNNPTPVNYEITDLSGDVVRALATVTYLPTATDDESRDNPAGSTVSVPILGNDVGLFNTSTSRLLRSGTPMMTMSVADEGTWRMFTSTSEVQFTPLATFRDDPTPVSYRVMDVNGNVVSANVTITYLRTLALTGMSVDVPLWGSIVAIVMGLCAVLFTRMRRVARHRM